MIYFDNVYLFIFLVFTTVWISILIFGSNSAVLIKLFFAANYPNWEGFFSVENEIAEYVYPAIFLFILMGSKVTILLNRIKPGK